jgi:hypothetical protein
VKVEIGKKKGDETVAIAILDPVDFVEAIACRV